MDLEYYSRVLSQVISWYVSEKNRGQSTVWNHLVVR